MVKTRLTLFYKDSISGGDFLNLLNFLIFSVGEISLQDDGMTDKVRSFRSGHAISFDFTAAKLPEIIAYLSEAGFEFRIDN